MTRMKMDFTYILHGQLSRAVNRCDHKEEKAMELNITMHIVEEHGYNMCSNEGDTNVKDNKSKRKKRKEKKSKEKRN